MLSTIERDEARILALKTRDLLIIKFGKTASESEKMINDFKMEDFVAKHPIALHESPFDWALRLLTKNKDYEALDKLVS
jgi:hypothetical protein